MNCVCCVAFSGTVDINAKISVVQTSRCRIVKSSCRPGGEKKWEKEDKLGIEWEMVIILSSWRRGGFISVG